MLISWVIMPLHEADRLVPGNTWARYAVDPYDTLPSVYFKSDPTFITTDKENYSHQGMPAYGFNIFHGDRLVGEASLSTLPDTGDFHFTWIEVDNGNAVYQKGMGLASYLVAIEAAQAEGKGFVTDHLMSKEAKKIWYSLAGKGVAEVIEENPYVKLLPSGEKPTYDGSVSMRIPYKSVILTT
jgi:hypothetical protein